MPEDKWGIPYWYPTKTTAGITNSGSGFFWEQNNNFRVDEDAGFLRLGKETDDCELIDLATGTWEFPYLTDGDGISISGSTGHHSGGEEFGCEGFTYMCDCDFEVNPPRFRFRKETYHVQYDDHPDGEWSHSSATGPVTNNWKGLGWVRYNKKDGRAPGKDSVICEVWWNDNPTANIKNWVMLKRVEDKGEGITNWGVSEAVCDGDPYQVGTWSNIQFRFKSSSSDFSLHPLIPETNDGENVHSIGEANMSFSDSEARGYGKRADMPRDIEMKCLFKWDAGGAGKCHFKNISLREIDPTKSFGDDPTNPDPSEQPSDPTTIQGFFEFKQDINHSRTSSCMVGGGGGGNLFYNIVGDTDVPISNNSAFSNRTSVYEYLNTSSSDIIGIICKLLIVPLKKVGTPGASPVITAKIYNYAGTLVYTSPTTIDPTTLTTSLVDYTFSFSTNTRAFVSGDSIGIGYLGTSSSNYIVARYQASSTVNDTRYAEYRSNETGFTTYGSRELACKMYQD
jgi:hypothetical protein